MTSCDRDLNERLNIDNWRYHDSTLLKVMNSTILVGDDIVMMTSSNEIIDLQLNFKKHKNPLLILLNIENGVCSKNLRLIYQIVIMDTRQYTFSSCTITIENNKLNSEPT